jgi:uncharacterized membrane protein
MASDSRGLKILVGALGLVLLLGILLGGGMMGPGMMGDGAQGGGWAWGLGAAVGMLGMLGMLAFPILLVVGVVLLVLWAGGQLPARGGPPAEDPQAILRRRYAAGEIDQATFERLQRQLAGEWDTAPRQPVGTDGAPKA